MFALKHHCFDIEFLAKDENEPRPLQLVCSGQLVPVLKHISIEDRQSIIDAIDLKALEQRPRDYQPLISTLLQDNSTRVRKHLENGRILKSILTEAKAFQETSWQYSDD